MTTAISLDELRARGVAISAHEAVAIAQTLIDATPDPGQAHAPYGPPTPDTIVIDASGRVMCSGCATTPAVFEVGILLQSLLPQGSAGVPGGLRYSVARALLDVEAPPFDSLAEFSRSLARFEHGERAQTIAALHARGVAALRQLTVREERRHFGPPVDELRRQLREADRQLFEERRLALPRAPQRQWSRRAPIAACLAAGVSLIAAGELMHISRRPPAPARTTPAVTAPVATPSAAGEVAQADTEDHIGSQRKVPRDRAPRTSRASALAAAP